MPVGLVWANAGRRWSVITAMCLASASIEGYQALLTDRSCQVTDLASNGVGALVGVLLVVMLRAEAEKHAPSPSN